MWDDSLPCVGWRIVGPVRMRVASGEALALIVEDDHGEQRVIYYCRIANKLRSEPYEQRGA